MNFTLLKNKYCYGFVFALIITLISVSDIFYNTNQQLNDLLYQQTKITNPDICIIGIDAKSIDELGSFPFPRDIYAQLITMLNESSTPPIAIGIDILFTGQNDTVNDSSLVETVSKYDNVILSCSANYTTDLVVLDNGEFYVDQAYLDSMNYPFEDLLEVATLGHINNSLDKDGILRHSILNIKSKEGEYIPSLNFALYQKYCEFYGMDYGQLPESNSWYLPYTSKSGGYYDGYSLSKVLSGEIPTSVFANKIVFLGPYTIGLQDHFYTAIDHTNLQYGVEFQANALDVLINKNFVIEVSAFYNQMFLFFISWILFILTYRKKLVVTTLVLLFSSGLFVFICKNLYHVGYLFDVLYLPLSIVILYVTNIFVSAVISSIEKMKITSTFKRYVAPEVVETLIKEGTDSLKLGGVTTDVAVMFIDVRNFTPMSEKFPAEIVIDILNRFLDVMAETIMQNGGTLDKFIGDAIMCFWGAPLPQRNYIYKTVDTALQIIENIQPIIKEVQEKYDHQVSVGIGIQCGPAVVGNIGSNNRMDFTVIGDTVNTAARLESNAKGNVINVSHDVRKALYGRFDFTEIQGGLKLKGKEGMFRVYTVSRFK